MPLAAILEAREQRWRTKRELAQRFHACVLSLCLNIPGPDKNLPGVERTFALLREALRTAHARELQRFGKVPVLHEAAGTGADGQFLLMVSPLPDFTLKHMAVRLEHEHPLGRLADIDILTQAGKPVSRADLGLAPRACFLCGEPAALCRQEKRHPQHLLVNFTVALLATAMPVSG